MQLKGLLVTILLFFSTARSAQEQENNHLCLNIEMMQKKLVESANDSIDSSYKKHARFAQKFLTLSEEEQKKKIGKWLALEHRKYNLLTHNNIRLYIIKNKKFDDHNLDFFSRLSFSKQCSAKELFLDCACGGLMLENERSQAEMAKKIE